MFQVEVKKPGNTLYGDYGAVHKCLLSLDVEIFCYILHLLP